MVAGTTIEPKPTLPTDCQCDRHCIERALERPAGWEFLEFRNLPCTAAEPTVKPMPNWPLYLAGLVMLGLAAAGLWKMFGGGMM